MTATDGELADSTALVTGASSGIGRATAEALAAEGADVALAARREDELRSVADGLETDHGVDTLVVPTDVTDDAAVEAMVDRTVEAFDGLDVLVNNAGVMLLEPVERASADNLRQMTEVNLLGLMNATRTALPALKGDGGHVVNVSSVAGRKAYAGSGGYNATKFGVNGFSEALREETAGEGVRVTVVEPGVVDTELPEHIPDEEQQEQVGGLYDALDALEAEDVADVVRYAVTRPDRVAINELLVRPRDQEL